MHNSISYGPRSTYEVFRNNTQSNTKPLEFIFFGENVIQRNGCSSQDDGQPSWPQNNIFHELLVSCHFPLFHSHPLSLLQSWLFYEAKKPTDKSMKFKEPKTWSTIRSSYYCPYVQRYTSPSFYLQTQSLRRHTHTEIVANAIPIPMKWTKSLSSP